MQVDLSVPDTEWKVPQTVAELHATTMAQWQAVLNAGRAKQGKWLQAAARLGELEAQVYYGQWCWDSPLVSERNSAFYWFRLASEKQHPMALNMLGRCYELGTGTRIDMVRAVKAYQAAADAGLDWGMYNLANLLATGRGVDQDQPRAFNLYLQAAGLRHAKSMNLVGRYYEEGLVVPCDKQMALAWYRESAELGDFRGRYSYATVLAEHGQFNEAAAWLRLIPMDATPAFLKKIVAELRLSENAVLRAVAEEIAPAEPADTH